MITTTPTAVSLLVTVVLLLSLTGLSWRYREERGAKIFGALQALNMVWALLTVVGLSLSPGPLRLQVWGATQALSLVSIVFWLAFIFRYTGQATWVTRRRFALLSLPLAFGSMVYVLAPTWPMFVGQVTQSTIAAGTVVQGSIGPLGSLLGVHIYLVFLLGLVLVVKTMFQGNSLFVGQALALALGTVMTVGASVLSIAGLPTAGYPTTQVALGLQTLFWGYAVFGQQFLQTVPAVATIGERTVLEDIDEGVLVVDRNGTVIRANAPARSYLDIDDLVGQPVSPLFDQIGVSGLAGLPVRFQSGRRTYRMKASPVTDWRGGTIGHALVIQDVTQLFRRQQRLQVMNRILRHNVRNSMNVVLGLGGVLRDHPEERFAEMGGMLTRQAEDLTTISEKAIEIDRTLDNSSSVRRVDLRAIADQVVEGLVTEYPDATVTTNIDVAEARLDRQTLVVVLTEIVENALEHTGNAPEVALEVERANAGVRICVADDGPGIPDTELEPVATGEETELQHASSLGLWLVKWGAQSMGGDLDISTTNGGSVVTVWLPDAPAGDTTSRSGAIETGETDD